MLRLKVLQHSIELFLFSVLYTTFSIISLFDIVLLAGFNLLAGLMDISSKHVNLLVAGVRLIREIDDGR